MTEIDNIRAASANVTHIAVSDVTPDRCTVMAAGDEGECRATCEDDGDDTWQVMRIADGSALGTNLEIGERAHHAEGCVW